MIRGAVEMNFYVDGSCVLTVTKVSCVVGRGLWG